MIRQLIRIVPCVAILLVVTAQAQTDEDVARQARRQKMATCRAFLKTALASMDEGRYTEAEIALDSVLICDPDNPDAYYHKARIALHGDATDTTAAASALTTGVERAPRSTRLKLLLARVHLAGGKFDDAATLLDDVLAIKPREGEALYLKSLVLLNRADTTQALELMEKAFADAKRRTGL